MARNRESKIELTAYDDLFQTDESRAEAGLSKIRDIPISEIVFANPTGSGNLAASKVNPYGA